MSTKIEIVAEVGSVHDGSFGNAAKLIELTALLGADTVKFQTHIAEAETTRNAPSPPYFDKEDRFRYFERTGFSRQQWHALKQTCAANDVGFLSSPFSIEAVELLEEVGVGSYKIASGEVTNLPLLEAVAGTGKPVLLSSGMSDWAELDRAVEALSRGRGRVTILQCTTAYPCPPERVGLNVIGEMQHRYKIPVGLSDHTEGIAAALAAAALGASVIEKHLTFSRAMYGSDAANAAEPETLRAMIDGIRAIEAMMAHPVDKADIAPYREMKAVFEKSVVTRHPVAAGERFTKENLTTKKPGTGLPAACYSQVLGRTAIRDLPIDSLLSEDDIAPASP